MIGLSELEQDALTEIFNIGVGIAAQALYQLVGEQVPLSVPVVALTSQHGAQDQYLARDHHPLYAIRQTYRGEFTTEAILLFPAESSLDLVRMMVDAELPEDALAEMAQDALGEIGNIILNAVIANLSSTLHLPLAGSLPTVRMLRADAVFGLPAGGSNPVDASAPVLALMIDFELSARQVSGYLAFLLDEASTETLLGRLAHYIDGSCAAP